MNGDGGRLAVIGVEQDPVGQVLDPLGDPVELPVERLGDPGAKRSSVTSRVE